MFSWLSRTLSLPVGFVAFLFCIGSTASKGPFTNEWAVCIKGGMEAANEVARLHGFKNLGKVTPFDDIYKFVHYGVRKRQRRSTISRTWNLIGDRRVLWTEQQVIKKRVKRSIGLFDDKRWKDQWYLYRREKGMKGHDMNVLPAWSKGITGKGVVVSILDDGIEYGHPELSDNYDKDASYDYNSNDPDPKPMWTFREANGHGTRCAAEVAAVANNSQCIVGVAYNANIGGIRMLDGDISDMVEAQSLGHAQQYIDIYSASWGPDDDGKTVDGPGNLTRRVLEQGAKKGRHGKGNIFVWASGNGGHDYDNCNCDGYTNSIYTISVSTATDSGAKPFYLESCASTLVSTYGTGSYGYDRQIVTADLQSGCTVRHTGTSVAAPFVAGFVALALQVNPSLTWRDVQHLIVNTANPDNLDSGDFRVNGVGRKFSHHFGYGMIDGGALVNLAENWHLVSEQRICESRVDKRLSVLNNTKPLLRKLRSDACRGTSSYIRYLEHVHLVATLFHSMRGSVSIYLKSPSGTRSQVLAPRRKDDLGGEFRNWAFMSTHFWGEDPTGTWEVEIRSGFKDRRIVIAENGFLENWKLVFYGTEFEPGKDYSKLNGTKPGAVCHVECQDGCSGPGPEKCTRCRNFLFQNKTCVRACPEKYFTGQSNIGTNICLPCHPSCRLCSGSGEVQCTKCFKGQTISLGLCHKECDRGQFWNNNTTSCRKCDTSCAECMLSASNCTACREGQVVRDGMCSVQCKKKQYFDGRNCVACHRSCVTCDGPLSSDCTSCNVAKLFGLIAFSSQFLLNGTCLTRCPSGYYANYLVCKRCAENCKECRGPKVEQCDQCDDGYLRLAVRNSCVKQCPKGHFVDFERQLCEQCAHTCEECVPGKREECLSCPHRFFLKGSQCVFSDECDFGFYANYTTRKCELCPYPCAACEGHGVCTNCALNFYVNIDGSCVDRCPSGSYLNDTFVKCMSCHPGCSECSGPSMSHCTACRPGRYLYRGKCVHRCPIQGYYSNTKTRECLPCFHSCAECIGPKPNHCKKCIKNLDLRLSNCYPPCIDKYLSENSCKPCDMSCQSCLGPTAFDCLSCPAKNYLFPSTYSCLKTCPMGYYEDDENFECRKCHPSCGSCSGGAPTDCLSCAGTLTYLNQSCIRHCPAGYYVSQENICKPCEKECLSCLYKPDLCTTCVEGYVLSDFKCRKACRTGHFLVKGWNKCFACHRDCESCNGFGANACTSCAPGTYLFNSMCLDECPHGFMANKGRCLTCDINCAKCTDQSSCLQCHPPFSLHKGMCVSMCPVQYVTIHNKCVQCHPSCLECFHRGENSCTICIKGLVKTPFGTCTTQCPDGTYYDRTSAKCHFCHEVCKTCSGNTMQNCTSCGGGMLLHEPTNSCVLNCPSGFYAGNGTCHVCFDSCKECLGTVKCLKCHPPYFLHNGSCVQFCPGATFEIVKEKHRLCAPCHESCSHCSGPSDSDCIACKPSTVFHVGQCLPDCPQGFYQMPNASHCEFCSPNCLQCRKYTGACKSCIAPYSVKNDQCALPCEMHFYYDKVKDECEQCHDSCQTCSGSGNSSCTSCHPHFALVNETCRLSCVDGFYADRNSLSCQPCHKNCSTCFGPDHINCHSCEKGLLLKGTSCTTHCAEGFTYDASVKSCQPCPHYCATCTFLDGTCMACLNDSRLENGTCVPDCTASKYYDESLKTCTPCAHGCAKCTGSEQGMCLNCLAEFYEMKGHCLKDCLPGWFRDGKQCSECPKVCTVCYNSSFCVDCVDGTVHYNGSCWRKCPRSTYLEEKTNRCDPCPQGCKLCDSRKICYLCEAPLYLQEGTCLKECNAEFVSNSSTFTCDPVGNDSLLDNCNVSCSHEQYRNLLNCTCHSCAENCLMCNSSAECQKCMANFTMKNGKCKRKCDDGFRLLENGTCGTCPYGCLKCQLSTCTQCQPNFTLSGNECLLTCYAGYFRDKSSLSCQPCAENCLQCASGDACIICRHRFVLDGGKCMPCLPGYYFNMTTQSCSLCSPGCYSCSTEPAGSCSRCHVDQWLYKGSCVANCSFSEGLFSNNVTGTCDNCSTDCRRCLNEHSCILCSNTTFLHKGICIANCSVGSTFDPEENKCVSYESLNAKPNIRTLKSLEWDSGFARWPGVIFMLLGFSIACASIAVMIKWQTSSHNPCQV